MRNLRAPLFFALFAILSGIFSSPLLVGAEIIYLSAKDASRLLNHRPDNLLILDTREKGEYSSGHLKDAISADYLSGNFEREIAKVPVDTPLFLYCRSGRRTRAASEIAERKGFKNIYVLENGVDEWRKAGLPVEK